jgi:hypothetical protein
MRFPLATAAALRPTAAALRPAAAALLLLVAAIARGSEAQVLAPEVHIGDSWKYRQLDGFTNETQFEVTHRVVDISDHEIVLQVHNLSQNKTALRYFNRDWNAVDLDDSKYDPYYPEYRFPLVAGMTWTDKYTAFPKTGSPSSGYVKATVSALEKVVVPAGTFDAYRIVRDQEARGNNEAAVLTNLHMTTWYAPSVRRFVRREWVMTRDGRVREKAVLELVEYSLSGG